MGPMHVAYTRVPKEFLEERCAGRPAGQPPKLQNVLVGTQTVKHFKTVPILPKIAGPENVSALYQNDSMHSPEEI